MVLDRRSFLQMAAGGVLSSVLSAVSLAGEANRVGFKAIAFDAFPIFDPRPIAALAESLFPGNGQSLMNAWRVRQFDYQWLRALSGQYVDFLQATRDSLIFAAKQLQLEMNPAKQEQLMTAWSNLRVWPDVADAVKVLRDAGLRLAFLSNMTSSMITAGLKEAKLECSRPSSVPIGYVPTNPTLGPIRWAWIRCGYERKKYCSSHLLAGMLPVRNGLAIRPSGSIE